LFFSFLLGAGIMPAVTRHKAMQRPLKINGLGMMRRKRPYTMQNSVPTHFATTNYFARSRLCVAAAIAWPNSFANPRVEFDEKSRKKVT